MSVTEIISVIVSLVIPIMYIILLVMCKDLEKAFEIIEWLTVYFWAIGIVACLVHGLMILIRIW